MALAHDRIATQTAPGFVKGTLSYMAPELFRGKPATAASDLYSLGCTLWEALTGARLFEARSDVEVVEAIRQGKVPRIAEYRDDVNRRIEAAILKALSPDPDRRFASARAMANELNSIIRSEGPHTDADEIVAEAVTATIERARSVVS
jgi:serine/threonine-protein kinase